jgi:hypothetical protein
MWNVEDFNNDLFEIEKEKMEVVVKDFSMDKPSYLLEYVRKNKNNRDKKGVLLAVKQDDKVVIGWSLCRSNDKFNKYFGHELAYDRGMKRFDDPHHFDDVPDSILIQLDRFVERCEKYFKDCELPLWAI